MQKKQNGQILIIAIVLVAVLLSLSASMVSYSTIDVKSSRTSYNQSQALELAEAGMDKALYQMNQSTGYTGETNTALGNGTFTVAITSIDSTTKSITATGYIPNNSNPVATKVVKARANIGSTVISFRYGVQVGNGGMIMNGGSTINGSVYSNGTISATSGVNITGAAIAANPPSLYADQVNNSPTPISSCSSSNCITFGNAASTEDFSQSFKISTGVPLNNIQFYMKKVGSPSDATVHITTDNSGSPSTTTLLSGTLSASTVTTNFGWVTATMPTTPILDPDQTYWIVIDAGTSASKYYIIGANSNTYANGTGKIGKYSGSWSNTSPSGLDGYFQIYLGGGNSMIGGNNYVGGVNVGTTSTDDTWAHTVMGSSSTGTIYCQSGTANNKSCNTSRSDPTSQPMPLSDQNIQDWKDDAVAGGTQTGDVTVGSAGATLGPKKIIGNLIINGGGTLTVSGTLWVTGTITLTSGGKVKLSPSYGTNSGVIVNDGYISLTGGSNFAGSGQTGSYPFLITTSDCPVAPTCSGNDAIYLSGGAGTVALIAQEGNITINGGSSLKQVTGKQIGLTGGATLFYDSGLISENFSSGPGGSWQLVSGSYIIK